jgi:hypothetical protein
MTRIRKPTLEEEARAIVLLAFRNGPIEGVHAGRARCPGCKRSGITDAEMKQINKVAVNRVWMLLKMRVRNPQLYRASVLYGSVSASDWDAPEEDVQWEIANAFFGMKWFTGRELLGSTKQSARPLSKSSEPTVRTRRNSEGNKQSLTRLRITDSHPIR